jgi:hypothetical protein
MGRAAQRSEPITADVRRTRLGTDQTLAFTGEAISRGCAGRVARASRVLVNPPDSEEENDDKYCCDSPRGGLALPARCSFLGHGQTVVGAHITADLGPRVWRCRRFFCGRLTVLSVAGTVLVRGSE